MISCFINLSTFILSILFIAQPLILLLYSGTPHVVYAMSGTAALEKHKLTHYIEHSPCIWTYHTYPNNRRYYMMIQVFWDMMLCRQFLKFQRNVIASSSGSSTPFTLCGLHDPEYEGTVILWNVWNSVTQQHSTTSIDLDYCSIFKHDYFSPLECNTMVSGSQHVQGM